MRPGPDGAPEPRAGRGVLPGLTRARAVGVATTRHVPWPRQSPPGSPPEPLHRGGLRASQPQTFSSETPVRPFPQVPWYPSPTRPFLVRPSGAPRLAPGIEIRRLNAECARRAKASRAPS